MVKVNYFVKENKIERVEILGHSSFADYGQDIVCASISSIVITTVNACLKLDEKSIKHVQNEGVIITVLKHSKEIDTLINNMIDLLTELSKDYKENIKIGGGNCVWINAIKYTIICAQKRTRFN